MRGVPLALGEAYADGTWAVDDGTATGVINGIEARDPVTGRQGWWIETTRREEARSHGLRVEDPSSRIVRHLGQVVRTHSDELLTRQHVHDLIGNLRQQAPRLVDDAIPDRISPTLIHRVLCGLLRERVPIRDLETIIESLGDQPSSDADGLIEVARHALRRTICQQYRDENRRLDAVTLHPELEALLLEQLETTGASPHIRRRSLQADQLRPIVEALLRLIHAGRPPVIVCSTALRAPLRRAVAAGLPQAAVLSRSELTPDTELRVVSTVTCPAEVEALT
jgi:flagellar biosynthesis protein FlhA